METISTFWATFSSWAPFVEATREFGSTPYSAVPDEPAVCRGHQSGIDVKPWRANDILPETNQPKYIAQRVHVGIWHVIGP